MWYLVVTLLNLMLVNTLPPYLNKDDWDNTFIKHHQVLYQALKGQDNLTDCWICTHSPVSSKSMPYLAIPVTLNEIRELCNNTVITTLTGKSKDKNVPLPVAAWMEEPWMLFNRSGPPLKMAQTPWASARVDLACYPSFSSCSCIHIKSGRIPFSLMNYTECNGTSSIDTQCVGIDATLGQMPPCVTTTLQMIREALLLQVNNTTNITAFSSALEGNMVAKWVANLFNGSVVGVPKNMYIVCEHQAYKWLPSNFTGTCTLAYLTPATFIIPHVDINVNAVPRHTLYKRKADNRPRPDGRPHVVSIGTANAIISTLLVYPMITQMWDKLVEATDYLDQQIFEILNLLNATNIIQRQLIVVANQHTIVLDYLTASQGGMCQIVGPACCHYIDPAGSLRIKASITKVADFREKWLKEHKENEDSWWGNTFSFLNPANWFKGIGGWIAGIIQGILHILLIILVLYILVKLVIYLVPMICKKTKKIVHHKPKPKSFDDQYPMS
ncbi:uncharacterized protein LOC142761223 [Rhinoderma darwinii]|uniref:uncharacterized protein LOC142761223 n=1 Tax=Rhinoderma darwinii TaxID=43563 RepID=UPI003F661385